jgi:hypothetical protein
MKFRERMQLAAPTAPEFLIVSREIRVEGHYNDLSR